MKDEVDDIDGIEYGERDITATMDYLRHGACVDKKVFPSEVLNDVEESCGRYPGVDASTLCWQYRPNSTIYWKGEVVYRCAKLYGLKFEHTPEMRKALGLPYLESGGVISKESAAGIGARVGEASCCLVPMASLQDEKEVGGTCSDG